MSIYTNLGLDDLREKTWISKYNKNTFNNNLAKIDHGVIVLPNRLFHISTPDILENGHLPECEFKFESADSDFGTAYIECTAFHSFENFPKVKNLEIIGKPFAVDYTTLDCCKKVSFIFDTDYCELKNVPVPIQSIRVSLMGDVKRTGDKILKNTKNCVFEDCCEIYCKLNNTNSYKELFKNNAFKGNIHIKIQNPQTDYSFLEYAPACVNYLSIVPDVYDGWDSVYDPIFKYYKKHRHTEWYLNVPKTLRVTPAGDTNLLRSLICDLTERGKDYGVVASI